MKLETQYTKTSEMQQKRCKRKVYTIKFYIKKKPNFISQGTKK